jgi:Fe-S-cluster containining protein
VIDCQDCGACCKGFTVDVESRDEGVPPKMIKEDRLFGPVMRERDGQCIALSGKVGERVRCRIYEDRPQVCRDFSPGCLLCHKARELSGLSFLGAKAS